MALFWVSFWSLLLVSSWSRLLLPSARCDILIYAKVSVRFANEEASMKWERPELLEIGMNAEIGGYQSDFGEGEPAGPRGPVAQSASDASTGPQRD
jgi:hypothetical protein